MCYLTLLCLKHLMSLQGERKAQYPVLLHAPSLLPRLGTIDTDAVFHSSERGLLQPYLIADTAKQRLTNQGKHWLIYCLAGTNNRPSLHGEMKNGNIFNCTRFKNPILKSILTAAH
ncbi:hypothetical protein AMECASPLE_003793 [Ameca splendens]|uniref:Uncharacterized protein n=1 Tax=Ameca splendens TaxID=208324 RepID=A0ABV0Y9Z6_9TELE